MDAVGDRKEEKKEEARKSSLVSLGNDIMAILVHLLDSRDLCKLLQCGNGKLTAVVVQNWREVRVAFPSIPLFPFSAFSLPHLTSLTVERPSYHYRYMDLRGKSLMDGVVSSKTLETLSLDFLQAGTLLRRSSHSRPLEARFPALTKLDLTGFKAESWLVEAFGELPSSLTFLTWTCSPGNESTLDIIPIRKIAKLSRNLTNLTVSWPEIGKEEKEDTWKDALPEGLIHLQLRGINSWEIAHHLPRGMEKLYLRTTRRALEAFKFGISLLPPKLEELKLESLERELEMDYDEEWPKTMRRVRVRTKEGGIPPEKLPPWLTRLPREVHAQPSDPIEIYERMKGLKKAWIGEEASIARLPKGLTNLRLMRPLKISNPLPSCLKILTVVALHRETVMELPRGLREMEVRSPSSLPPPFLLSSSHLSHFPPLLCSLTLTLNIFAASEVPDVSPLKNLFFLRKLSLSLIEPSWCHPCSKPFLVDCIPPLVEELRLSSVAFATCFPTSWFKALRLLLNTPSLRLLTVLAPLEYDVPLGEWFEELPRGLECLYLDSLFLPFPPSSLSFLPLSLSSLSIHFDEPDDLTSTSSFLLLDPLSDAHFLSLPPSLTLLDIVLPCLNTVSPFVVRHFPPFITEAHFITNDEERDEEILFSIRAHLSSLPHMLGYMPPLDL